ncbi:hypothetical protein POZ03_09880 [Bacteroides uniformis]|uniref:hypothetical protein n=1 Tax=Bacteroides uniformis TaxID=820 RepID=UPI00233E9F35|nr:hypothetical protein [Bacteroides uniformis]MDC1810764.1 hypothetical protein [Bacteroides uniformis]
MEHVRTWYGDATEIAWRLHGDGLQIAWSSHGITFLDFFCTIYAPLFAESGVSL